MFIAGHHPDLHLVGWNNITIEIWTHAVGEDFLSITWLSFSYLFCYVFTCKRWIQCFLLSHHIGHVLRTFLSLFDLDEIFYPYLFLCCFLVAVLVTSYAMKLNRAQIWRFCFSRFLPSQSLNWWCYMNWERGYYVLMKWSACTNGEGQFCKFLGVELYFLLLIPLETRCLNKAEKGYAE